MNEELIKALAKQGIDIKWGFDGKPQYYRGNKILTGKAHGDAALLHTKISTQLKQKQTQKGIVDGSQSPIAQLFDVTGISGWRDLKNTVIDNWEKSSKLDKGLAVLGAAPGLSILAKPSKIAKTVSKVTAPVKKIVKSDVIKSAVSKIEIPKTKNYIPTQQDVKNIVDKNKKAISSTGYAQRRIKTTGESIEQVQQQIKKYSDLEKKTKKIVSKPDGSILNGAEGAYTNGFFNRGVYIANNLNEGKALNNLDHEIKHLFSPTLKSGAKKLYENYPKLELEGVPQTGPAAQLTKGDISYLNMPEEQQVRFSRFNEKIRKDLSLPDFNYEPLEETHFNKWLSDYNIDSLTGDYEDVKDLLTTYTAQNFDKGIPKEQTRKKIFETLNNAWGLAPIVGVGGATAIINNQEEPSETQNYASGGIVKYIKKTNSVKNKKTKKNLKDLFAYGGVAMNVATPSEELAKAQRVSQQAHFGAMLDPTVAGLIGVGNMLISTGMSMASKGMSQSEDMSGIGGFLQDNMGTINSLVGAGQSASYYHAAGGVVNNKNINAEGGEVIETPGGQPQELQGPSHSQGGINMQVPSGTEIYSDRLVGADGKTMAERKKLREKQISKIEKLLQKNPNDSALKKTLEKIKQNNDFLDKQDLSQMQFVKDLVDHTNKFAFGGIADTDEDELIPLKSKSMDVILPDTSFNITPEMDARIKNSSVPQLDSTTSTQQKGFSLDKYLGGTTLGDMIGMGANLFGANAQMKNTLANRNATPLEQNAFKNFGDQALKKIQSQYGLLDDIRDNQLQNAERNRQGTIARNNNSARGINTQRALNLATDSSMNELKANIYNQYASNVMGITKEEAAQMDKNDQMRMTGEDRRAERELQNTDNFFSNMAKNISDKYRGIGETGKFLNKIKERNVTQKNIEEQLELLKSVSDSELRQDSLEAARLGLDIISYRNLKNQKSKK